MKKIKLNNDENCLKRAMQVLTTVLNDTLQFETSYDEETETRTFDLQKISQKTFDNCTRYISADYICDRYNELFGAKPPRSRLDTVYNTLNRAIILIDRVIEESDPDGFYQVTSYCSRKNLQDIVNFFQSKFVIKFIVTSSKD